MYGITEAQSGFMPKRSITDAIFAMRQLIEKYREKRMGLRLVVSTWKKLTIEFQEKKCRGACGRRKCQQNM